MSIYLTPKMIDPGYQPQEAGERFGVFRQLAQSLVGKWRLRRKIAAFEALDDRLLQDIGIFRADNKHLVDWFDGHELRLVPMTPAQPISRLEGGVPKEAHDNLRQAGRNS